MISKLFVSDEERVSLVETMEGGLSIMKDLKNFEGRWEANQQVTLSPESFNSVRNWLNSLKPGAG